MSKEKRQVTLKGDLLPASWSRPSISYLEIDPLEAPDDVEKIDPIDLDKPIWEHFRENPITEIGGAILYGNCGAPGYSQRACWEPVLDDLCVSCPYHYENDPDFREEWEEDEYEIY